MDYSTFMKGLIEGESPTRLLKNMKESQESVIIQLLEEGRITYDGLTYKIKD